MNLRMHDATSSCVARYHQWLRSKTLIKTICVASIKYSLKTETQPVGFLGRRASGRLEFNSCRRRRSDLLESRFAEPDPADEALVARMELQGCCECFLRLLMRS